MMATTTDVRTIDVFAWTAPARQFTGDFYVVDHRDDALWFAVGDVAGKGLDAAVLMALVQETLETSLRHAQDPAELPEVVASLQAIVREEFPPNRFVTMVAGVVANGRLHIVNAGHPAPLLRDRAAGVFEVGPTGPVLSPLLCGGWTVSDLPMSSGAELVVFTDGVTEAADGDGRELGGERVSAWLHRLCGESAASIVAALRDEVASWSGGRNGDDTTILALTA